jgi:hypothetical protein
MRHPHARQAFERKLDMAALTILVNSSDGFEDCWKPFFQLFRTYWPDCSYPLVLNTETKTYQHAGLEIANSCVALNEKRRLTWSECLMRCLDRIDTPYVLYLQEDFFLEAPVRSQLLDVALAELQQNRADVIRLMECGGSGPTDNPMFWRVDQKARYRIALQAALWRKSTLTKQLRAHESPWQLEVFGSGRARRRAGEIVLCVNREQLHGPGKEIFQYTPTGVVKGQWEGFVPSLFEREGIEVDFTRRGFYDRNACSTNRAPLVRRVSDRLRSLL